MAHIRKREGKNGVSYQVIVSCGYDIRGRQICRRATFTPTEGMTEKQIQKALNKFAYDFERKVLDGEILEGQNMLVSELFKIFMENYAQKALQPATFTAYETMFRLRIEPAMGHIKLGNIKRMHIQCFINSLAGPKACDGKRPFSYAYMKKCKAVLSIMFNKAVEWQLIRENPADKVVIPKAEYTENEDAEFFTPEQTISFLNVLNSDFVYNYAPSSRVVNGVEYPVNEHTQTYTLKTQFKVLFNMAIYGGFRRGEMVALTWADIDFEKNTVSVSKSAYRYKKQTHIKVPKNKSSKREITLPEGVMSLLAYWKQEQSEYRELLGDNWKGDNYIFIQWDGKMMDLSTPNQKLKSILKYYNSKADDEKDKLPDIHFHSLRHTSASLLIASNLDVRTVSARLGHAAPTTTVNIPYRHTTKSRPISTITG